MDRFEPGRIVASRSTKGTASTESTGSTIVSRQVSHSVTTPPANVAPAENTAIVVRELALAYKAPRRALSSSSRAVRLPFRVASTAEHPERVEFTIKALGDFTELHSALRPGRRVFLDGPYGEFTIEGHTAPARFRDDRRRRGDHHLAEHAAHSRGSRRPAPAPTDRRSRTEDRILLRRTSANSASG
jgi:hypothetical protein